VSDVEPSSDERTATARGDGITRGRTRRTTRLVGATARTIGEALVAALRGKLTGADSREFHERTAERYTELLGSSKGALMKAGEMLSFVSAGTIVPTELRSIYQTALARLRTQAPPMAPELARTVLERELGRRAESAFAELDWEPLAAASIGQVHAGRLHDGRAVAVKIQYPGVAEAIRADLQNTELIATFLSLMFGGMSPIQISFDLRGGARELSIHILAELDYRLEAASQADFASRYRGHPFIHVPEVIGELCTGRVLTQELVHGRSWNQALTAEQELRNRWAEAIWRFIYGSNMRFCLVNADPHPGNYLFHDDGSVSFLDFGCVKHSNRELVAMMTAIGRAVVLGDVHGTWRASVEAGFWRSSDPVTPDEAFAYWHEPFEMFWGHQPYTVTPERAARWIERRFSPTGPSAHAFRYIAASPEYMLFSRIETGAASVIAELDATNDWRSIAGEYFVHLPPVTAMGKRDHAFFAERDMASQA
jgi:predicted unusual protein kinase regulating ubiquinone biosynthesis (AarF/ABC1/UbiB family)